MKRVKKILSIVLSITMLLSITAGLDFSAYAASIPNSGKCGTNVSYSFNSSTGTLTISGSGDMQNYTDDNKSPFAFNSYDIKKIKKIVINSGVTSIGNQAFCYCDATSVSIPNTIKTIGESAFKSCRYITSITIPNSVKEIKEDAFFGCYGAKTITIGSGVTTIGESAFSSCYGTPSITVPNSVTSIDYSAFNLVNNVKYHGSASGSPWDAKSVNGYVDGNVVYNNSTKTELLGCSTYATSVSIPGSVKTIGKYAFYNCERLTSVTIPNNVTSIGISAFEYCDELATVSLSNKITNIDNWTFSNCLKLKNITIPSSVDTICWGAFYRCFSLFGLVIPDSVTTIENSAFALIKNVIYNGNAKGSPWGAQAINGYVDSYLVYSDSSKKELCACRIDVKKVVIPKSVTKINEDAFYRCYDLTDTYYTGNESLWNTISIGDGNTNLDWSTKHYNYVPPCKVCTNKKNFVNKATASANGSIVYKCATCGTIFSTTVIPKASNIKLSATSYTYDGKVKTPSVTIKDSKGKVLKKNTDYTISYASGRKNVGKYAVKIIFKGNYSGTKTLYFYIKPKSTSISKVTATKKGFKVYWKKQSSQTNGYQIQYATNSKFSKAKTVTVTKNSTTSKTVSKLSAKKKYYVRVRTYKTVNGTKYYSSWSKAKAVTTKK